MITIQRRTGIIFVASSVFSIPALSFTRVALPTVSRDTLSAFSTATSIFTVPASADYLMTSAVRLPDNTPPTNIGHGFSLTDTETLFHWQNIYNDLSFNRSTVMSSWARALVAGDPLRLVVYSEAAVSNVNFSVTIAKLT